MKYLIAIAALLGLACWIGYRDHPKGYMITNSPERQLPDGRGMAFWLDGEAVNWIIVPDGDEQRLLSFLILTPDLKDKTTASSGGENLGRLHTVELTFGGNRATRVLIEWDKVADLVEIDGTEFDRSKGTFFVAILRARKAPDVWQFELAGQPHENELIAEAQRKLPSVEAVQSLPSIH